MSTINKIVLPNGEKYHIEVQTENINGILPLDKGGTNANNLDKAKENLGIRDNIVQVYPINEATQLSGEWLSKTINGNPIIPETGVIYILLMGTTDNHYLMNTQFRWNGSSYVKINTSQTTEIQNISNQDIQQICV